MSFKVGDKVRLAPHVTDEMLDVIFLDRVDVPDGSVVDRVGVKDEVYDDAPECDVRAGGWYVPSAWLVLDVPARLDAATLARIIAELRAPIDPVYEDGICMARSLLDRVVEEMRLGKGA